MAFDVQTFLRQVEPSAIDRFLELYGNGQSVDWQQSTAVAANRVLDAPKDDDWAISALENCELIAANGGRDLLRSAGHRRPELMPGVDNLDFNVETCAVWLATQNRELFDDIVSAAHALKGLGTRSWDAFRITHREQVTAAISDVGRLGQFKVVTEHLLKQYNKLVPSFRSLSIGHFEYAVPSQKSNSRRPWTQVNVYAQTAPVTHEILVNGKLRRVPLPGLYRASIIFDPTRSTIEVVAKGGRTVRDELVNAFCKTFLPPMSRLSDLHVVRSISNSLHQSPCLISGLTILYQTVSLTRLDLCRQARRVVSSRWNANGKLAEFVMSTPRPLLGSAAPPRSGKKAGRLLGSACVSRSSRIG